MSVTTLSTKFQISIPKDVRDHLDWKAGQKLTFIPKGKGVMLVPVPSLEDLRGMVREADTNDIRDRLDRLP